MTARDYSVEELLQIADLIDSEPINPSYDDLRDLGLIDEQYAHLYMSAREQEELDLLVRRSCDESEQRMARPFKKGPFHCLPPKSFMYAYRTSHAFYCPGRSCSCHWTRRLVAPVPMAFPGAFGYATRTLGPINPNLI